MASTSVTWRMSPVARARAEATAAHREGRKTDADNGDSSGLDCAEEEEQHLEESRSDGEGDCPASRNAERLKSPCSPTAAATPSGGYGGRVSGFLRKAVRKVTGSSSVFGSSLFDDDDDDEEDDENNADSAEVPFRRSKKRQQVKVNFLQRHVGKVVFRGKADWTLENAGKQGGLSAGGPLSGTYSSDSARAFIKRDANYRFQIAEVLASRLINAVLPGYAAKVDLVVPAWSNVRDKSHEHGWMDVYIASHHHPRFVEVFSEHEIVKNAFGGHFNPVKYGTPLRRAGSTLQSAFPNGTGLFSLQDLQKCLIGDLLIANNDSHLGNLVLFKKDDDQALGVQAFDFGAAFNMEAGLIDARNCNERVGYSFHYRGAIKTEVINQIANYPASWTVESKEFWSIVATLPDFPTTIWREVFTELREHFSDIVLIKFLQKRVKVGNPSMPRTPPYDGLLEILVRQFAALMRQRLENFRNDALEMLHDLGAPMKIEPLL
eukprot:TRINITY_DN21145_c0_g2_i1.p1 TRINITY_DN21145_c0_g2~~TRINITY_DN21145_c0_g2_i1.p1  ORF type:complete len:491 (+),score=83.38 TRINITY_DN21145_c0_g2_i1:97-1569(+)